MKYCLMEAGNCYNLLMRWCDLIFVLCIFCKAQNFLNFFFFFFGGTSKTYWVILVTPFFFRDFLTDLPWLGITALNLSLESCINTVMILRVFCINTLMYAHKMLFVLTWMGYEYKMGLAGADGVCPIHGFLKSTGIFVMVAKRVKGGGRRR